MHTLAAALLLVIRAYDVYGVAPRDLRTAASVAGDALRAAGLELRVVHCPPNPRDVECSATPGPADILVRMMRAPGPAVGSHTLGQAFVDTWLGAGSSATLYTDRIAAIARESRADFGTVLGRAMAHEVGHLLLGTPVHAARGLMRAAWSVHSLRHRMPSDWVFDAHDVNVIRSRFQERLGSQVVVTAASIPAFARGEMRESPAEPDR